MDLSAQRKKLLDRNNLVKNQRKNISNSNSNSNFNSNEQDTSNPLANRKPHPNKSLFGRSDGVDKNQDSSDETKDSSEPASTAGNSNADTSDESTDLLGGLNNQVSGKIKGTLVTKALAVASPFLFVGIFVVIIIIIVIIELKKYLPFLSYGANTTISVNANNTSYNSVTHTTSETDPLRAKEDLFNQKLDEVWNVFNDKANVSIDIDYIIGALFYDKIDLQFLESEDLTTEEVTGTYKNGLEKIYILAQYQVTTHIYENNDSGESSVDPTEKREVAKNDASDTAETWYKEIFNGTWNYEEANFQTHYGEFENLDTVYTVDVSKKGVFYWNLVDGDFITTYYANQFTSDMTDAQREAKKIIIADRIYQFVEDFKKVKNKNYGYLTDGLKVNLYTCDYNETLYFLGGNGYSVSTLANEGTSYPTYTNFKNYVKGAIYGEIPSSMNENTKESVKAFIIAFSSYALARSSYSSGATEIDVHVGNCWQLSCDPLLGCQYCNSKIGKYGTNITGVDSTCPHGRIWSPREPLDEATNAWFDSVVDEVFGTVMMNASGNFFRAGHYDKKSNPNCGANCMGQADAVKDAANGMTYEQILAKYYSGYELVNIKEDLYIQNANYGNGGVVLNQLFHYHQGDYTERNFCGRSDASIASSGCGVVAGAIAVSLLKNQAVDPKTVMEFAHANKMCGYGISGTDAGVYELLAKKHQLNYSVTYKDNAVAVVDALKTSKAVVVAHIPAGTSGTYSSGSGHYIVFVAINANGQALVWDPGYRNNPQRDNAWHDMNELVKYTDAYYILSR